MRISKKFRFEVFKRDAFTCQYCGRKAPDVVLQVDHIKPKSKGGTNDLLNLVTSCSECNSGKSNRELSDDQVVRQKRKQLEDLQQRKEQLEMMFEWQKGLLNLDEQTVASLAEFWGSQVRGYHLNDSGLRELRKLRRTFDPDEIMVAMRIAAEQYLEFADGMPTHESVELAWKRTGGICRNCRLRQENPDLFRPHYIRGILRNRLRYINEGLALELLSRIAELGGDMDAIERHAKLSSNWSEWRYDIEAHIRRLESDQ